MHERVGVGVEAVQSEEIIFAHTTIQRIPWLHVGRFRFPI